MTIMVFYVHQGMSLTSLSDFSLQLAVFFLPSNYSSLTIGRVVLG